MKSFLHYYLKTFKDIIANQSILTTLILSVIFYSVFYPTAYKAQQAEALPIVIVDEEQSIVTNNIIQQVSLSPNVEVKAVTGNFLDAENMIKQQQADGILLLPENLSNSLRHGEVGGIGLYLSAANFLKTKQIGLGLATSIENTVREHVEKFGNISHFSPAISIHQTPLFNTMSGYGSYIFPAIAPLIIHQTIVLGLGMLLAGYREQKWRPTTTEFFAIFCAILTIGMLGCLYLFGFIYWLNDYPHGGNFSGMLLAVPIFIRFGLYRAIFRYTGMAALTATAQAVGVYTLCLLAALQCLQWMQWQVIPRSIGILQPLIFLLLVGSSRSVARFESASISGMPPVLTGAGSSMLFCPIAMDVKIKAVKASNTVFIPK